MIQTSLTTFIIMYVGGALLILLGLSLSVSLIRRFRDSRHRKNVVICEICGFVREDNTGQRIVRCDECASLNERTKLREI